MDGSQCENVLHKVALKQHHFEDSSASLCPVFYCALYGKREGNSHVQVL